MDDKKKIELLEAQLAAAEKEAAQRVEKLREKKRNRKLNVWATILTIWRCFAVPAWHAMWIYIETIIIQAGHPVIGGILFGVTVLGGLIDIADHVSAYWQAMKNGLSKW